MPTLKIQKADGNFEFLQLAGEEFADIGHQVLDVKSQLANTETDLEQRGVNIKNFGAVGDGVTDDTQAIQTALENGHSIIIPHGIFLVSGPLNVKSEKQIIGHGSKSVIRSRVNGDNTYLFHLEQNAQNVTFRDFQITHDTTNHSLSNMIRSKNGNNILIDNLILKSKWHPTERWSESGATNKLKQMTDTAINLVEATNSSINNCHVEEGFRVAYRLENRCFNNKITSNVAKDVHRGVMINTDYTTFDGATGDLYDKGGSHHNIVSNNVFEKCYTFGIKNERGSFYNIISNNEFEDCGSSAGDFDGVIINAGEHVKIQSNMVRSKNFRQTATSAGAIRVLDEGNNCIISGNTLINSVTAIRLSTGKGVMVTDNKITTAKEGIYFTSVDKNFLIKGNLIQNATEDGIYLRDAQDGTISSNVVLNSKNGIRTLGNLNKNILINGNVVDNSTTDAIYLRDAYECQITNNSISNSNHGVRIQDGTNKNNIIQGNEIKNMQRHGIRFTGSESQIVNNSIVDCNLFNSNFNCIQANGCSLMIIKSNTAINQTITTQRSIVVQSCTNTIVTNNIYNGPETTINVVSFTGIMKDNLKTDGTVYSI